MIFDRFTKKNSPFFWTITHFLLQQLS